jgi:protein-tyrosine phosphatase
MTRRRPKAAMNEHAQSQVFPITRCIVQGAFASKMREPALLELGVSHILNVGEGSNVLIPTPESFKTIVSFPIVDLDRIPDNTARTCLDHLHQMILEPGSKVYVHCIAGQNRSPVIVWLYLIACGIAPAKAKEIIARRNFDAIPDHGSLVDRSLVRLAQEHGRTCYLPHARPEALEPA